jgi:hypothetical protein
MSLKTAISFCVVLAAAYYAWLGFREADTRGWNSPPNAGTSPSPQSGSAPSASAPSGFARQSWSRYNLGRATLECPCAMSPVADQRNPQQKQIAVLDRYKGGTQTYGISFTHAYYPQLRGEIMLDKFSRVMDLVAPQYDFSRYPSTSGAIMINGVRARRFDFDHVENSFRRHIRYVFFSKGNQAWAIGVESRIDTPEIEQIFQKIAYSLRPD